MPSSEEFRRRVQGFGLTFAKIHYYFPDRPTIINPHYIAWQFEDMYPDFPRLRKLLDDWPKLMDGPLHSVRVAHSKLIAPTDFDVQTGEFRLN